jgi:uncharacterized protein (TIGR02466 family)
MYRDFFPTPLIAERCDIDNDRLLEKVLRYARRSESVYYSNIGGEQYHEFRDEQLFDAIGKAIPQRVDVAQDIFSIYAWININPPGAYNKRHHHIDPHIIFSGAYYVVAPKDSGELKFHDPRGSMIAEDAALGYFYQQPTESIAPETGMLWIFPSWLEHEVTPNNSNETRISISFNISIPI